ncbi:DUF3105 domain-containing protein [Micromonospora sp. CPCC 206061]|uniref:DUF3105 domain-containing protein n=1 Tax=Micromonospora sp. CPCC 206061 TaxID=3122410 RepID=UPI002FF224E9
MAYPPPSPPPPPPAAPPKSRNGLLIGLLVAGVVAVVMLSACGIGGFLLYREYDDSGEAGNGSSSGAEIEDLINYRKTSPAALSQSHITSPITYPMTPPAGGPHFGDWQNCVGDVYTAPIVDGNAVHSLEHGAVWITHKPGLGASDVESLAAKVRGQAYMMMSPYPGQSSPISLQAWGYQLAVDSADDDRIDEFIRQFRQTATMEPGATCAAGITTTTG